MRLIDLNVFAEKSAREFSAGRAAPSLTAAWALRAFIALYQTGGKPPFRETVLSWLEKRVGRDGGIDLGAESADSGKEALGAALLFAMRETQDGRYRLAADKLMEKAGAIPNGALDESAALLGMEDTFLLMPFRAEYDVSLGSRQWARFIAARFRALRNALPMEGLPLPVLGLYLAALTDTLEKMDIQLYEHYRVLEDLLVEAAGLALRRINGETGFFGGPPQSARDMGGGALTAYALMKGARLGWLDGERYPEKAGGVFRRIAGALQDGPDEPPARKAKYACLMALAEEGRMRQG